MPSIAFMGFELPTAFESVPSASGWIHEIKYDGYRTQLVIDNGLGRAFSKNGHDWSEKYRPIVEAAETLGERRLVLDGEMISLGENGLPDFQGLPNTIRFHPERLIFVAFDILLVGRHDMRKKRLLHRKSVLATLLTECPPNIQISEFVKEDAQEFYNAVDRMGLEGIVSKRFDAPYVVGPSKNWRKIKCYQTSEMEVIGVSTKEGVPRALLQKPGGGYAGSAFVTLRSEDRNRFWRRVDELKTQKVPIKKITDKTTRWIQPGLRVKVRHLKGEENLRHASITSVEDDDLSQ